MDIEEERHNLAKLLVSNNWQVWCGMILRYHQLSQQMYGEGKKGRLKQGWSVRDTCESLKRSVSAVHWDITLAKALKHDSKIKECISRENAIAYLKENGISERSREDE